MLTRETANILPAHRPLARRAAAVTTVVALTLLASCAARPDRQTTNAIPDDYRTRHPITLAEAERSLDVPIGAEEHGLTFATRDLIKGFGQDYAALSKSTLRIAIPSNAANSAAAYNVRSQIRRVLVTQGIPASRILLTSYDPQAGDASAPIRLSFVAVTAITDECGQWPSDLVMGRTVIENKNYENFGCSTQQNLAAQIANPTDLVGPRGMTPIDAANRSSVLSVYRDGPSSDTSE